MKQSIYKQNPQYETKSFKLRLISKEDAESLLECYSDKAAVAKMNDDFCLGSFYYTTIKQMQDTIEGWVKEYEKESFMRLSIISKANNAAIGSVEIFGGEFGILRIDIATAYDTEQYIEEILKLAIFSFVPDFEINSLKIKVANTPERIEILKKCGFVPAETFKPELGYYERIRHHYFDSSKGLAYCGLACCVCSENATCVGCRNEGCENKDWCKSFQCGHEKGHKGCWECDVSACDNPMLNHLRIRTFSQFIKDHGEEKLINCLQINEQKGIIYHYDKQLVGDYDLFSSAEEINDLLLSSFRK